MSRRNNYISTADTRHPRLEWWQRVGDPVEVRRLLGRPRRGEQVRVMCTRCRRPARLDATQERVVCPRCGCLTAGSTSLWRTVADAADREWLRTTVRGGTGLVAACSECGQQAHWEEPAARWVCRACGATLRAA